MIPQKPLGKMNVGGDSPVIQQMLKEHEESATANEKIRQLNELLAQRDTLENQIVFLYTRQPYATEELKKIATDVLNNEAAVQRLVAKVEIGISQRGLKERDKVSKEVVREVGKIATFQPVSNDEIPLSKPYKKVIPVQSIQQPSVRIKTQTPSYVWVYWLLAALIVIITAGIAGLWIRRGKRSMRANKTV